MNLEADPPPPPLMVLMMSPLSEGSRLLMLRILSGSVFGSSQPVRLRLLIDAEGVPRAEELRLELESCSFGCMDGIDILHEFRSIEFVVSAFGTADVICFLTTLPNPNRLQPTDSHPAALNALDRVAMDAYFFSQALQKIEKNKPIVVTDGLICQQLLKLVCKHMMPDMMYCPTPLHAIGKSVLGLHLKVKCDEIKDLMIWAADDETFYMHAQRPLMKNDEFSSSNSGWELMSREFKEALQLDHTKFNDAWMKNNLIEKTKTLARKNPYGPVCRALSVAAALKTIWLSFGHGDPDERSRKIYCNMGVISRNDDSYGLEKGLPCVLPLVIECGKWKVNETYKSDTHVRSEVKKMIKASKEIRKELKFWRDNARSAEASVPEEAESWSMNEGQCSCPCTGEFPAEEELEPTKTNAFPEDARSNSASPENYT